MAINFAPIQSEAFKPTAPDFRKLFQEGLDNYIKTTQAKYAPQMAEAQLSLAQSQAQQHKAIAEKTQEELSQNKAFRQLLAGLKDDNHPMDTTVQEQPSLPQTITNGINNYSANNVESNNVPKNYTQPNQPKIVAYGDRNLHKLDDLYDSNPQYRKYFESQGLKKKVEHKLHPESGETFVQTTYPSGKVTIQAVEIGKQPKLLAREKELGKGEAESYNKALEVSSTLQGQNDNLDYILNKVENSEDAKNAIGPVNTVLTNLFGTKAEQDMLGNLYTSSGNIALEAAKNIKGAFTGKDQNLINSIKPNPKDPYNVFVGKLKAMRTLNNLAKQRVDIYTELMDKGYSSREAAQKAQERVSFKSVEDQLNSLNNSSTNNNFKMKFSSKEEFNKYITGLNQDQREQYLSQLSGGK